MKKNGNTLIEILIAIAILAITMVAFMGGFSNASMLSSKQKKYSSNTNVAQAFIEELQTWDSTGFAGWINLNKTKTMDSIYFNEEDLRADDGISTILTSWNSFSDSSKNYKLKLVISEITGTSNAVVDNSVNVYRISAEVIVKGDANTKGVFEYDFILK